MGQGLKGFALFLCLGGIEVANDVIRVPIKIRKPIQKEMCTCRGIGSIAVEGDTCWHKVAPNNNLESYKEWLDEIGIAVPNYFVYSEDMEPLIRECLWRRIPVVVETTRVLPSDLMQAMIDVPHCAVHISLSALETNDRELLGENVSSLHDLVKMSSFLKTWKVVTRLRINCLPHLVSLYDYCEILDLFRNYTTHAFIHFPRISDEWLCAHTETMRKFPRFKQYKRIYQADVLARSWALKQSIFKKWVKVITEYAEHKKIRLQICDTDWSENRVRLTGNTPDKEVEVEKVLGLRKYIYLKIEGAFVKYDNRSKEPIDESLVTHCSYCGNTFY